MDHFDTRFSRDLKRGTEWKVSDISIKVMVKISTSKKKNYRVRNLQTSENTYLLGIFVKGDL